MTATHVSPRQAFPNSRIPRSRSPVYPEPDTQGREGAERLAGFLGWFSIGLGLTRSLAPRGVARFIGVRDDRTDRAILRLVGLQELACGVGILSTRRPAGWVWARVAGDVVDLALLGGGDGLRRHRSRTGWRRPPRPSSASPPWTPTTPSSSAASRPERPGPVASGPLEVHVRRSRSTGPPRSSTASGATSGTCRGS